MMADVTLDFACGLYDRTLALYTGEVKPEGFALNYLAIDDPRQIFDRLAGGREFDAAEFSSSELVSRHCAGDRSFVAIPVFPSRVFRHGFVTVNRRKGIRTPKDLEGKRIGVPLYTMTAAIFIRGMLQHEYGVDLSGVRWLQGAINTAGAHGNPTVPPMLKPVEIENNTTGRSLSDLLAAGEIDAIIGANLPDSMKTSPDVVRLFPDYHDVEKSYYRKTRIFPIMHLVAIRRRFYEAHPEAVVSFYDALCRSKERGLAKMRNLATLRYMLPWMSVDLDEIDEVFGGDPWPYGIVANRPTLTGLVTYLAEQGLIAEPPRIEDIFVPVGDDRS
ncbi:MAG: 4,5-dihydroxyphthalate decarboxylase [Rhodospirillales bacterium]|jgi:4,5-dihydroxyphthalate decarboxylase|nr:4,5-dihydroxyphthalate decarboxylase [Rhodospirillales bacterium]